MKSHYYKTKMVKMGKWALMPNDSEVWHGEHTGYYFKKHFGIPKGLLGLHTADGYQHMYVPEEYFGILHRQIEKLKNKDYKNLERKLRAFYPLVKRARTEADKAKKLNLSKLTNKQLAQAYRHNREWVQRVSIFDQFAWLGEEYWTPKLEHILANRLRLVKGSEEYNTVLFALTKPEEISSTLKEKRSVLEETLKIKSGKSTLEKSAARLAKQFGWMPVFTFGNPWKPEHYTAELKEIMKRKTSILQKQFQELKNYRIKRNREIAAIVKKYRINKKDLQVFLDFGLAIDTRNEAEYFVGYAGFYLVPMISEIAKRLYLSINQVRTMTQQEIEESLLGKKDPHRIIQSKGKFIGWGFNKSMTRRTDYKADEAEELFQYIESYVKPVQGHDENKGVCASPGKVTGKIRIVPSPDQNSKVQDGDILVTYATTTDYLPAMKRAAAIVTEVGGLTCHAAVVSREFGIPCIVALKNAMSNFRDGDMVEINATKGIIKKL